MFEDLRALHNLDLGAQFLPCAVMKLIQIVYPNLWLWHSRRCVLRVPVQLGVDLHPP